MITMIRFDSDYIEGCIPEILEALAKTNSEHIQNLKKAGLKK